MFQVDPLGTFTFSAIHKEGIGSLVVFTPLNLDLLVVPFDLSYRHLPVNQRSDLHFVKA